MALQQAFLCAANLFDCVSSLPLIPRMQLNCSFGFTSKILHFPTKLKTCRRATDLSRRRRILLEPISQLLNLSIHQSVDSLYLFLLVRRNWPLSFELFNKISPSFIPPCPPQPLSFALNCREVLWGFFFSLFFSETRLFIRHSCSAEPSEAWICCQEAFSLAVGLCFSLFLSGGMLGAMNRQ